MRTNKNTKRNAALKKNRTAGLLAKVRYGVFIIVPVVAVAAVSYFIFMGVRSAFPVRQVVFTGNEHMTDEELRALTGLKGSENLLTLSGRKIYENMLASPWVRRVSIRKELPDRLHMIVTETEPFALLDMQGRLFIVDENGKMLEELKDSLVPFLPVISGNPFSQKEAFSEAVHFAKAIKDAGLLSRKDHIEIIANRSQEMAANFDGILVKVGAGDYETKLARLMELEEEIKTRNIPVDYIDLRFANSVIVKPVTAVVKR